MRLGGQFEYHVSVHLSVFSFSESEFFYRDIYVFGYFHAEEVMSFCVNITVRIKLKMWFFLEKLKYLSIN
jgi:hypothetical protein